MLECGSIGGMAGKKLLKTARQIERHLKGVANHRRIEILWLIEGTDEMSVEDLSTQLNCNFKTVSEHTRRLVHAGLVDKKYHGRKVLHRLSPYGEILCRFIRTFQHS